MKKGTTQRRTAIVTGGSKGIGFAIAQRLNRDGYRVGVISRHEESLRPAATAIADDAIWCVADLGVRAEATTAIDRLCASLGKLDVLVNNAGFFRSVSAHNSMDDAERAWDEVINSNLKSTFLATMAAIPHLNHAGRIINIGSIAGQAGSNRPGGLAYAAAKAGIQGFTASLARELASGGITVNTVAPGLIAGTEFFGPTGISGDRLNELVQEIPVARAGTPEDVAAAVSWLASRESSFITGALIPINGGWRIG